MTLEVSIHAPREGCDPKCQGFSVKDFNVSIHAPREGCDNYAFHAALCGIRFQFTHPGRGATSAELVKKSSLSGFNSRTPGGVRLQSIDAKSLTTLFQFTHPGRGATT